MPGDHLSGSDSVAGNGRVGVYDVGVLLFVHSSQSTNHTNLNAHVNHTPTSVAPLVDLQAAFIHHTCSEIRMGH